MAITPAKSIGIDNMRDNMATAKGQLDSAAGEIRTAQTQLTSGAFSASAPQAPQRLENARYMLHAIAVDPQVEPGPMLDAAVLGSQLTIAGASYVGQGQFMSPITTKLALDWVNEARARVGAYLAKS